MSLPELHGWAPAAVVARRLAVTASTVRRRASKGALDVIPNPIGAGALYREKEPTHPLARREGGTAGANRANSVSVDVRGMGRAFGVALEIEAVGVAEIVRELGSARSTAHRTLCRMEERGFLRSAGELPSGPRGGRPRKIWTVA